jgi:hypothetical protein
MSPSKWMTVAAILLALAAAGCSDDEGVPADGGADLVTTGDGGKPDAAPGCDLPAHSCYKPFVCRVPPSGGAKGCWSADGDVPSCKGTPSGQVVPFNTTGGGLAVHWAVEPGCVAITYSGDVVPQAAFIDQAALSWSEVACSSLCFDPPQHDDNQPEFHRRERRIHILSGKPTDPTAPAQTDLIFEETTGRIMKAEIIVDMAKLGQLKEHHWLPLIGLATGLAAAPTSTDSVLAKGWTVTTLSKEDEVAICKLYGTPSYCGD